MIYQKADLATGLRFACVGLVGFLIDAGLLSLLSYGFGCDPLLARGASFLLAVLVTFALNRSWSFKEAVDRPILRSLAAYLSVQGLGSLCNILIFMAELKFLRRPFNEPLVALVVAASIALAVNYIGARRLVFQRKAA